MKRSLQEIAELVVFGLIALLVGTGLIWLLGGLFKVLSSVFFWLSGLLWVLLKFIIPIALVLGVVFFLVRLVVNPRKKTVTSVPADASGSTGNPVTGNPVKDAINNAGQKIENAASSVSAKSKVTSKGKGADAKPADVPVANDVSAAKEKELKNRAEDAANEPPTRADDAEPVDVGVDTSGYKEMDDEAEDLEGDNKNA